MPWLRAPSAYEPKFGGDRQFEEVRPREPRREEQYFEVLGFARLLQPDSSPILLTRVPRPKPPDLTCAPMSRRTLPSVRCVLEAYGADWRCSRATVREAESV